MIIMTMLVCILPFYSPLVLSLVLIIMFMINSLKLYVMTNSMFILFILLIYVSGLMVIYMMISFSMAKLFNTKSKNFIMLLIVALMTIYPMVNQKKYMSNSLSMFFFMKMSWLVFLLLLMFSLFSLIILYYLMSKMIFIRK